MWDDISGSVGFSKVDGLMKFSLTRTGPTGRQVTVNSFLMIGEYVVLDWYRGTLDSLVERMEQAEGTKYTP